MSLPRTAPPLASTPLEQAEALFLEFFNLFADGVINIKPIKIEIKHETFRLLLEKEKDLEIKKLISLYWHFLVFFQTTINMKQQKDSFEQDVEQCAEAKNNIGALLEWFKENQGIRPTLGKSCWNYLTHSNAGIYVLFHLTFLIAIHPDMQDKKRWIEILKGSIKNDDWQDDTKNTIVISLFDAFEFLMFEVDPAGVEMKMTDDSVSVTKFQSIVNQATLTPEEKRRRLEKLKKVAFDRKVPLFIIFYIQNVLLYKTIMLIPHEEKNFQKFLDTIKKLTFAKYFIGNLHDEYVLASSAFFYQMCVVQQNIQSFCKNYTMMHDGIVLSNNTHTLKNMYDSLAIKSFCLFDIANEKMIRTMEEDIIKSYLLTLQEYILKQPLTISPEEGPHFWSGVVKLFAHFAEYNMKSFVSSIDRLIPVLYHNYSEIHIKWLLTALITYLDKENKTKYQLLLSVYQFCDALTFESNGEQLEKEFVKFVEHLKITTPDKKTKDKYDFNGLESAIKNKALLACKKQLKFNLLTAIFQLPKTKITELSLAEDTRFLLFQNLVVKLLQSFNATEIEMQAAREMIDYEDNQFLEIKDFHAEQKIEAPTKTKPKNKKAVKNSSPLMQTSLFATSQDDHTGVKAEKFPEELLNFTKVFKKITGQDFILVGGAVYHIFTDSPAAPTDHDWDGLGLNIEGVELRDQLKEEKYECKLIDGYYTTRLIVYLPYKSPDAPDATVKIIQVDISFYKTNAMTFDLGMKSILLERDLYDSILFIKLAPGLDEYRIRGYNGAIHAVNKGLIKTLKDPRIILESDFTRLLRIAKKRYQHPQGKITRELELLLNDKDYFPQLFDKFVQKGCGVSFVAPISNKDIPVFAFPPEEKYENFYNTSELDKLYLYRNEKDGTLFYKRAYHGKSYWYALEIDAALFETEQFTSMLCKNETLCRMILEITHKRKHTGPISIAHSKHNRRKFNTVLQGAIFEVMDVNSAMQMMENTRILDSVTGLTLDYLRPTLDIFIDYCKSDYHFRMESKDKMETCVEAEAYAKTVAFHYFIHIHYGFLKRYENSAFKDYLAERYQSKSFKNCPLRQISQIAYDPIYHPNTREMLDYIERVLLDTPAPENKIVNPSPHLVVMINKIGQTYDPAFTFNPTVEKSAEEIMTSTTVVNDQRLRPTF